MRSKLLLPTLLSFVCLIATKAFSQQASADRTQFFNDTSTLEATLSTNLAKLLHQKKTGFEMEGTFISALPDSTVINDRVLLEVRGHFRKDNCYLPPIKIHFKYTKTSALHDLGALKLVSECRTADINDQYLLKEFICYKMYNLITDYSFRVRLLNLHLVDSAGKKKPVTEHAFLIEDIKDVAKRNKCAEWKSTNLFDQDTDRDQMTLVALFEYMIGNTDWGVPVNHNTRLVFSKIDSARRPLVVPYDFDFSGFVNTDYAVPDEKLSIQSVSERLYRGFPRTLEELNRALDAFRNQKENIYALIKNFNLLTSKSKKEMTNYLDDFFEQINKPDKVKYVFIENARKN